MPLEMTKRLQLRWRDMDMLGHLNQSVYHELLEEARGALIVDVIRRAGVTAAHGSFVLAHVDLDYHREIRRQDGEVDVTVRVASVGTSSIRVAHTVALTDGAVAASGHTVLVAWDPVARGKRPLRDAERAALEAETAAPA